MSQRPSPLGQRVADSARAVELSAVHGVGTPNPLPRAWPPGAEPAAASYRVNALGWAVLGVLGSALVSLLLVACLGRVEVTTTALGALRAQSGPRPALARTAGRVMKLSVQPGALVLAGEQIALLDATELLVQVQTRQAQVEWLRELHAAAGKVARESHDVSLRALEQKEVVLSARRRLKERAVQRGRARVANLDALAAQGAGTHQDALSGRAAADATRDELLLISQQLADISFERAERRRAFETDELVRREQLHDAETALDEARSLVELSVIRAPEPGQLESLLVSEGQVIQAGDVVARVVPNGKLGLVAFAPSRDAAFLAAGLGASVEFPSLPVTDFGKGRATVTRVAGDLALPAEAREVLGREVAGEPLVRVELEIEDDASWRRLSTRLRSGAAVIVRIETRKRRIITLVFDFLRNWLDA